MLKGGCYCGRIRYEVDGVPFNPNICHCVDCRRVSGAPMFAWFTVKSSELRFVSGEPHSFVSSAQAIRAFCRDCGTQLTYRNNETPDDVDIATASLDSPEVVPPAIHVFTRSQIPWVRLADGLPTSED